MIRALVFDFDGLILDTELSDWQSWVASLADLPLERLIAQVEQRQSTANVE